MIEINVREIKTKWAELRREEKYAEMVSILEQMEDRHLYWYTVLKDLGVIKLFEKEFDLKTVEMVVNHLFEIEGDVFVRRAKEDV